MSTQDEPNEKKHCYSTTIQRVDEEVVEEVHT